MRSSAAGCIAIAGLALGDRHSCALTATGRVLCWGANESAQLGDGTDRSSAVPVLVQRIADAVEIASRRDVTCARLRTGTVACWGSNVLGEADADPNRSALSFIPRPVGDATPSDFDAFNLRSYPSIVRGISDLRQIAVGDRHACALRSNGEVICWGDNHEGQLTKTMPARGFQITTIHGLPPATSISAGGRHTCAIAADRSVWCWGDNDQEQLGTKAAPQSPYRLASPLQAMAIETSHAGTCVRTLSGELYCWGESGNCDDTTPTPPHRDSRVGAAVRIVRAYGGCFTCALRPTADIDCWSLDASSKTPDAPERLTRGDAIAIAAGTTHACAVLKDGRVICWGDNHHGQLGQTGPNASFTTPVPVQWSHAASP
jgi:alpha-tubulin suppressor-like RCC1 family protein